MSLLILVRSSLTLFGAFLLLTVFEAKYGRVGGSLRGRWDRHVTRATFIAQHIDWGGFIKHVVQSFIERVAHDVAHTTLQATRFIERLLTRAVRSLRERRIGIVVPVASRQRISLRETLRGFRKSLNERPKKGKA
jgi:hypothetical protein